jgi:hypothetical protein
MVPGNVKPGDPIRAEDEMALRKEVERLGRVTVSAPLRLAIDGGGYHFSVGASGDSDGCWIKLTSRSGQAHAWTEQVPIPTGAWEDGPRDGTTSLNSAYEANLNNTFTLPAIVWGVPEGEEWRFVAPCPT